MILNLRRDVELFIKSQSMEIVVQQFIFKAKKDEN